MRETVAPAALALVLCTGAAAAPWFTDLEADMPDLPWAYEGEVLEVGADSMTVLVLSAFRGDACPGDTVTLPMWSMGLLSIPGAAPDGRMLLLPERSGEVQVLGLPRDGFWLLTGSYDYNAFRVHPGVLTPEELAGLVSEGAWERPSVELSLLFAGASGSLEATAVPEDDGWTLSSTSGRLAGMELDGWGIMLGGGDIYLGDPEATMRLSAHAGQTMVGTVISADGGTYHCRFYPSEPLCRSREELEAWLLAGELPDPPLLPVTLDGVEPADLGLSAPPSISVDRWGNLRMLSGSDTLAVTAYWMYEPAGRPWVGFGGSGGDDAIYMDMSAMPEGPTGDLAVDLVDMLAKGTLVGEVRLGSPDGDDSPAGRFVMGGMAGGS